MSASGKIQCFKCTLVSYKPHHVEKYHAWMQSEELQQLTASEPLTMDEEYAMQQSWLVDDDKCTFIILQNSLLTDDAVATEVAAMVGDVNLFFNDPDDRGSAEIEVMIAERGARGLGLGRAAVLMMAQYAASALNLTTITAKIGFDNAPSLHLFAKLGFEKISESAIFREVTLAMAVSALTPLFLNDEK